MPARRLNPDSISAHVLMATTLAPQTFSVLIERVCAQQGEVDRHAAHNAMSSLLFRGLVMRRAIKPQGAGVRYMYTLTRAGEGVLDALWIEREQRGAA